MGIHCHIWGKNIKGPSEWKNLVIYVAFQGWNSIASESSQMVTSESLLRMATLLESAFTEGSSE